MVSRRFASRAPRPGHVCTEPVAKALASIALMLGRPGRLQTKAFKEAASDGGLVLAEEVCRGAGLLRTAPDQRAPKAPSPSSLPHPRSGRDGTHSVLGLSGATQPWPPQRARGGSSRSVGSGSASTGTGPRPCGPPRGQASRAVLLPSRPHASDWAVGTQGPWPSTLPQPCEISKEVSQPTGTGRLAWPAHIWGSHGWRTATAGPGCLGRELRENTGLLNATFPVAAGAASREGGGRHAGFSVNQGRRVFQVGVHFPSHRGDSGTPTIIGRVPCFPPLRTLAGTVLARLATTGEEAESTPTTVQLRCASMVSPVAPGGCTSTATKQWQQ